MDESGENTGKQHEVKSDAELHADAMAGGPEAFGPIVERYKDAVFGIALARVRDFHAAEDIAQTVLITAFEHLGSLREPSRLGAWLRSVTIHRSIDYVRGRRPVINAHDAMTAETEEDGPASGRSAKSCISSSWTPSTGWARRSVKQQRCSTSTAIPWRK